MKACYRKVSLEHSVFKMLMCMSRHRSPPSPRHKGKMQEGYTPECQQWTLLCFTQNVYYFITGKLVVKYYLIKLTLKRGVVLYRKIYWVIYTCVVQGRI